ncbi:ribonuclease HII [Flavobacteriaceae bacterium]|uniref:ribonuclease HII n=1 Tax=Candidatus Arcticimaribacter forsetii TaxID=2820661 RepID=UPI002076D6E3|nr:ribonuclease HII [Candidatus Arcticimaribacter forsetii]MDA8698873.1 ribonuclease HII [Flavobacteriaceae bacterium]MDB2325842.1 ribonuclease HII [Flavobacteriaceae bacterium]MDB2329658.1 ribonuclease HII [Flavobacteriaceae bacterium]MDB2345811.1 ribonuclease HII [Flavobacteriaceae bacterium]MDB4674932.1 ribonuclease HII [Flavobacteriaceae bacterium]
MLSLQLIDGLEAGTDEAGRGCLSGPVTAAAVILPADFEEPLLNDSKKLTEKQRYFLRPIIEEKALAFAVAHCSPSEIDKINILNASIEAMHRALKKLKLNPIHILVDGNRFHPFQNIPHKCIIKGDGKYQNIAAASVLAKTYRDDIMLELDQKHPEYDWKNNKGYPTKKHREAIKKIGTTIHHRKTFRLLPEQLQIKF